MEIDGEASSGKGAPAAKRESIALGSKPNEVAAFSLVRRVRRRKFSFFSTRLLTKGIREGIRENRGGDIGSWLLAGFRFVRFWMDPAWFRNNPPENLISNS